MQQGQIDVQAELSATISEIASMAVEVIVAGGCVDDVCGAGLVQTKP